MNNLNIDPANINYKFELVNRIDNSAHAGFIVVYNPIDGGVLFQHIKYDGSTLAISGGLIDYMSQHFITIDGKNQYQDIIYGEIKTVDKDMMNNKETILAAAVREYNEEMDVRIYFVDDINAIAEEQRPKNIHDTITVNYIYTYHNKKHEEIIKIQTGEFLPVKFLWSYCPDNICHIIYAKLMSRNYVFPEVKHADLDSPNGYETYAVYNITRENLLNSDTYITVKNSDGTTRQISFRLVAMASINLLRHLLK
jgi:hypothetical protein